MKLRVLALSQKHHGPNVTIADFLASASWFVLGKVNAPLTRTVKSGLDVAVAVLLSSASCLVLGEVDMSLARTTNVILCGHPIITAMKKNLASLGFRASS